MRPEDVSRAVSSLAIIPWRGEVWRSHSPHYAGDSTAGSRRFSGRYNRGLDLFPSQPDWDTLHAAGLVWEVLYTGLSWGVCMAELVRHLDAESLRVQLRRSLTQLRLDLVAVLDCSDLAATGLSQAELFHDTDYSLGQLLATSARARGCEGVLIPSAAQLPPGAEALVLPVFPDMLQPGSQIRVVRTVTPNLGADRP